MTLAGLKKCIPQTSSGRPVAEAISSMSSVEVLDASTMPGRAALSSLPNTSFLTAMSSNTASITRSASRTEASKSVEPFSKAERRSISSA